LGVPVDQVSQRDWTATAIAIYGAALATAIFFWNVYVWWADRGSLKVQCFVGRHLDGAFLQVRTAGASDDELCIVYTVTNVGRRPITVRLLGGSHRKWRGWIPRSWDFAIKNQNPTTLEPTDYLTAEEDEFLALGKITSLIAIDSLNIRHKAPWKDLREVRRMIRRLRKRPDPASSRAI
jgi:hypothetical protein